MTGTDPERALQRFANRSPRDERAVPRRYRAHLARTLARPEGLFLSGGASSPKPGTHPVGAQRPYRGAPGKKANCQVAASAHYAAAGGYYPPDLRLYLPDGWLAGKDRLGTAGVPGDRRRAPTEPEVAPELLGRARAEGSPDCVAAAGAGYGASGDVRDGPGQRGLFDVVGVTEDFVAFAEEPRWARPTRGGSGRPQTRPRLADWSEGIGD